MLVSGAFEFIAWSLAEGQAVAEVLVGFTPFRLCTGVRALSGSSSVSYLSYKMRESNSKWLVYQLISKMLLLPHSSQNDKQAAKGVTSRHSMLGVGLFKVGFVLRCVVPFKVVPQRGAEGLFGYRQRFMHSNPRQRSIARLTHSSATGRQVTWRKWS